MFFTCSGWRQKDFIDKQNYSFTVSPTVYLSMPVSTFKNLENTVAPTENNL